MRIVLGEISEGASVVRILCDREFRVGNNAQPLLWPKMPFVGK